MFRQKITRQTNHEKERDYDRKKYDYESKKEPETVYGKKIFCLFTAILITFLILAVSLSICFTVNADQEKPKRHAYKYYTDIVIQKGESLWDIANEHMTGGIWILRKSYIKEVKSINSLTDVDKIYAGQRIVIPYYSTELK